MKYRDHKPCKRRSCREALSLAATDVSEAASELTS